MSIGHSYVHSSNGRTEMSIGHKYMSIRPLDEQKCSLDIQMSIGPLDEWTNGHCLMASTLVSYPHGVRPLSYTITGGAARHEKVKPKTWRILASADAIWFLRLQVFTTDQPRCYAFDKVLSPLVFTEKNCGFPVFGTNLQEKILFFRLSTQ